MSKFLPLAAGVSYLDVQILAPRLAFRACAWKRRPGIDPVFSGTTGVGGVGLCRHYPGASFRPASPYPQGPPRFPRRAEDRIRAGVAR